jgi:hypothetical protein
VTKMAGTTYATVQDVAAGFRPLTASEQTIASQLLVEAAIIIDAYNSLASADAKNVVSCRMVRRSIGSSGDTPIGASQGSMSALGYSQSWTMGATGSTGELYLNRMDKKLLGAGNAIGSYSPIQELVPQVLEDLS